MKKKRGFCKYYEGNLARCSPCAALNRWLRPRRPLLSFLCTALNVFDKLEKQAEIIAYAHKIVIQVTPPKFGVSRSDYAFDSERRVIAKGLGSMKHIRVDYITELVANHLRRTLHFASLFEDEFVKIVVDERYRDVQLRQKKNQRELAEAQARDKEIDRFYEKIYEDQALGRLPEERFNQLAAKYDEEQAALRQRIRHLKKIVQEEMAHEMNLDGFLALLRRYTADFPELTPEMVQEFIDKVVVHHREKEQGVMTQHVEIYYKMVGHVNVPALDKKDAERLQVAFGRIRDVVTVAA